MLFFAVLILHYAGSALAVIPEPETSGWGEYTFAVSGLFWRRNTPESDFAVAFPKGTLDNFVFTEGRLHSEKNESKVGWELKLGFVLPSSLNDANLIATHWDNSNNQKINNLSFLFPTTSALFTGSSIFSPNALFGFFESEFGPADISGTVSVIASDGTVTSGIPFDSSSTPLIVPLGPDNVTDILVHSNNKNNAWDLEFGQALCVGCRFKFRVFGAVRYSRVEQDSRVTTNLARSGMGVSLKPMLVTVALGSAGDATAQAIITPVADVAVTDQDILHQRSIFNGTGPRFGFDGSYYLGCGFQVMGNISTSILAGAHRSLLEEDINTAGVVTITQDDLAATSVTFVGPVTPSTVTDIPVGTVFAPVVTGTVGLFQQTPTVQNISFNHLTQFRVVPNLDARLELNWTYQFCNCPNASIIFNAGYRINHYFHVYDRLSGSEVVNPTGNGRHIVNASFYGPYIGLQFFLS